MTLALLAWVSLICCVGLGGLQRQWVITHASFFTPHFNKSPSKLNSMSSLYTTKIRQNADLVNAISKCPFGEPIAECPFISYYEMRNERKQIEQIEVIPQEELDDMRRFHHACMQELVKTRKANFL